MHFRSNWNNSYVLQHFTGEELPLSDLGVPNIDVLLHKLPRQFTVDRSRSGMLCLSADMQKLCIIIIVYAFKLLVMF